MKMEAVVEVDVEPASAFDAFALEMDLWWGNGPIDAWSFSRTTERRVEPGVGGRVLEVYDDDVLELARITRWEPGRRLSWESSVDDVTIDVHFDAIATGTRVRVEGHVPDGGKGGAGLAVVRMAPQWLPRYFARGRSPWPARERLALFVRSSRAATTARWLCDTFGFAPTADLDGADEEPSDWTWIELQLGSATVIVTSGAASGSSLEPLVFVDDLGAHLAHAEAAGATIVRPIVDHGFASYEADDVDGRRWTFAQAGARQRERSVATPSPLRSS